MKGNAIATLQQAISLISRRPALRFDTAATAALMGYGDCAIMLVYDVNEPILSNPLCEEIADPSTARPQEK